MLSVPLNILRLINQKYGGGQWYEFLEIELTDGNVLRAVKSRTDKLWFSSFYGGTGVVRHFTLDDNEDTSVVVDSGPYETDATCTGYTADRVETGKIGNALGFDASQSQSITVPWADELDYEIGGRTVIGWFKPTLGRGKYTYLMKHMPGLIIYQYPDDSIVIRAINFEDPYLHYVQSSPLEDGWHLICVRLIGDKLLVDIFSENTIVFSESTELALPRGLASGYNIYFGTKPDAFAPDDAYYDGLMDDLKFFDRGLTDEELRMIWSNGVGTQRTPAKFTGFNFSVDWIEQTNTGTIPSSSIAVSNCSQYFAQYLDDPALWKGAKGALSYAYEHNLSEDIPQFAISFDIAGCKYSARSISLTLSAPDPFRQLFTKYQFTDDNCNFVFNSCHYQNSPECNYQGKTITGISLPSGNPVQITMSGGHNFETGDIVELTGISGTTELNGQTYTCTYVSGTVISLDGTDGDDFTTWSSGGVCGFATCPWTYDECVRRENEERFLGFLGLRAQALRIV